MVCSAKTVKSCWNGEEKRDSEIFADLGLEPLAGKVRPGEAKRDDWCSRFNPRRFDLASPQGQRKLQIVEALKALANEAGMTLIELSLRFVLEHPGVTSAIIGPRTMEQLQSQMTATQARLPAGVMDAIDRLVPPGETLSRSDLGYLPPALTDVTIRRRPPAR
jgi:aryl-alcohol dehydrogenase-like predicted oxidoreductase